MDTPDGNVTDILRAAQEGDQGRAFLSALGQGANPSPGLRIQPYTFSRKEFRGG
jgi:hypothetical protein